MYRLTILLLVFLSTACATYGPTAYRQAAPAYVPVAPPPAYTPGFAPGTPAAPVYTPAGAGLPGERVPGQTAPEMPRSPNRRVLPTSSEPGVWAADGDPALKASAGTVPEIAGVPIVLPKDRLGRQPFPSSCAATMDARLTEAERTQATSLPERARRCLAASLYYYCTVRVGEDLRKHDFNVAKRMFQSGQSRWNPKLDTAPSEEERAALMFRDAECGPGAKSDSDVFQAVIGRYDLNWEESK